MSRALVGLGQLLVRPCVLDDMPIFVLPRPTPLGGASGFDIGTPPVRPPIRRKKPPWKPFWTSKGLESEIENVGGMARRKPWHILFARNCQDCSGRGVGRNERDAVHENPLGRWDRRCPIHAPIWISWLRPIWLPAGGFGCRHREMTGPTYDPCISLSSPSALAHPGCSRGCWFSTSPPRKKSLSPRAIKMSTTTCYAIYS